VSRPATDHQSAPAARPLAATRPLFPIGALVATPAAVSAAGSPQAIAILLRRHITGDWAELPVEFMESNRAAVRPGSPGRVFSAYTVRADQLYVITEADRSITTVMLASEYLGHGH
jgi:hypothetical protein